MAEAEVTLVVAAPGSGKSTLLAQWAASRPAPVLWAGLRRTDGDPMLCGQRLVTALAPLLDDASLLGPPDLADERVRRRLVAAVAAADVPTGTCLVVEDLHRAGTEGATNVTQVVDVLRDRLPVVVSTRVDPLWPLAEWRMHGTLHELRQHDLDLADDEATRLLHALAPGCLDATATARLVEACGGWVAGLVLSGLSARDHPDPSAFAAAFSGADRNVADYLFDEVYQTLSDREQNILLATAVCIRFGPALAGLLSDDEGAELVLRGLDDRLMFLHRVSDPPGSYRLHDLFRGMLRQQLELERPGAAAGLCRRAAAWSGSRGDVLARCGYLAQVEDWNAITQAAYAGIRAAFQGRDNRTLITCLEMIPQHHRTARTQTVMAALCLTSGLPNRVREATTLARSHPTFTDSDALSLDRALCGLVEWDAPPDEVIAAADRCLVAADRLPTIDQVVSWSAPAAVRAASLAGRGRAKDLLGDVEGAIADLTEAHAHPDSVDVLWRMYALASHALVVAREGDHDEASRRAEQALEIATELDMVDHPMPSAAHLAEAVVALRREQATRCEQALDRTRTACLANDRWVTLAEERIWRAELHRAHGHPAEAKRCLDDIDHLPVSAPALVSDVVALRARVLVDEGRLSEAAHRLERAPVETAAVRAARALVARPALPGGLVLTPREQEVLARLVSYRTSAEIGAELHLSVHTVKTHQRHIYQKLGASTRREAIDAAVVLGLVD